MFRFALIAVLFISLSACETIPGEPDATELKLEQISSSIGEMESKLSKRIASACLRDDDKLVKELAAAIAAAEAIEPALSAADEEQADQCDSPEMHPGIKDRLVLGEVERVRFVNEKTILNARVDTGAETSSLGVHRVVRFERDGKKWVKFSLKDSDEAKVYRYPIYDSVRIKQNSDELAERRLEIQIDIEVGGEKYRKQTFNLADRSHMDYRALIGRSFLRDIAVVDVGRKYLLKAK